MGKRGTTEQFLFPATPGKYEKLNMPQIICGTGGRPTGWLIPKWKSRRRTQVDDYSRKSINELPSMNSSGTGRVEPKRMSKILLLDYFASNMNCMRYLHSDIDTVDRMEILRDLRLGTSFDVLSGINLLREGPRFPEVSTRVAGFWYSG